MNSTKRIMKLQFWDSKKSILNFWLVMLVVDIFAYLANMYFYNNSTGSGISIGIIQGSDMVTYISSSGVNFIPILIFFIVYNYEKYYESFPIAMSFSVTRKDFYKSLIVDNIFVSFMFALIQGIIMKIDPVIVKAIGRNPIYDFGIFNVEIDNLLLIIFYLFLIFATFASIWNLMAALNYKFGAKMWIVILGLYILGSIMKPIRNLINLISLEKWLNIRMDIFKVPSLGIIIGVCYFLVYMITTKTNIKYKVG